MNREKILQLKGVVEHQVMRDFTRLKVGGVADFFYTANSITDLIKAVNAAVESEMPYMVLGSGSAIVFSDYGFAGLVIENKAQNLAFINEKSQIIVDSGKNLNQLISECASNDLSGLEFLFGIPGTIGGAVYNNTESFGLNLGDLIKGATLLTATDDGKEPQVVQVDRDFFEFNYHSSKLKKMFGYKKPVILSLKIQLAKAKREDIFRKLTFYKNYRSGYEPLNSNSVLIFNDLYDKEILSRKVIKNMMILEPKREQTAAFYLDKWVKRIKSENLKLFEQNKNFLVNIKEAKAMEVKQIVEEMKLIVKNKANLDLVEEVEYLGQW